MTEWLGLPALAAAHGGQIDALLGWIHVFMLLLFVGWGGFIAYALVRFRQSRHPVANYTGVKSHRSTYVEIAVAVVEGVLLFGFAIPLWAARVDRMPPASEALVVQVTGEQFAWNVHYAGPDGKFGGTDIKLLDAQENPLGLDRADPAAKDDVTSLNQLYLPVNKPIVVRLVEQQRSFDAIVFARGCVLDAERRLRRSYPVGRRGGIDQQRLVADVAGRPLDSRGVYYAMRFEKISTGQCKATKVIKRRFGVKSALDYLIGEKLTTFAAAAEDHPGFATELPRFLAAIWHIFNEYEIAGYVASQRPGTRARLRTLLYLR